MTCMSGCVLIDNSELHLPCKVMNKHKLTSLATIFATHIDPRNHLYNYELVTT